MARSIYFNLNPRFTGGSPAAVWDEALAHRVAAEEKRRHEQSLTGAFGEGDKATAEKLGVAGIVEEVYEKGKGWMVKDLITGRTFYRERKTANAVKVGEVLTRVEDCIGSPNPPLPFRVTEMFKLTHHFYFRRGPDNQKDILAVSSPHSTVYVERDVEASEFKG